MAALQDPGIQRPVLSRGRTTKISISLEAAELVKIYCILNNKKMVDFTNEIFERELREFRKRLDMRKLKTRL